MRKHVISPRAVVNGVICDSEDELADVINTYSLPIRWGVVTQGSKYLLAATDAGGQIVTPEYQAILDYATGQGWTLPSAENQAEQNSLLAAMLDADAWDGLDVLYVPLTDGDANFAKINWKAPGTIPAPAAVPFVANVGLVGNNNNHTITIPFVNFTEADCSMIGSFNIPSTGDFFPLMGSTAGVRSSIRVPRQAPPRIDCELNDSTATQYLDLPLNESEVMIHLQRSAGVKKLFKNGIETGAVTLATGGINAGTGWTVVNLTATVRFYAVGASLVGAEAALYDAWAAYAFPIMARKAYADIIAYATSQTFDLPSAEMQEAGEALILAMMNEGAWDGLDVFYNFVTDATNGFHRINWKNPAVGLLPAGDTITPNFGMTNTVQRDTGFDFATAVKFKQDNASVFFSASEQDGNAPMVDTTANVVTGYQFPSVFNAYVQWMLCDNSARNGLVYNNGKLPVDGELYHLQRTAATVSRLFKDGTQAGADSAVGSIAPVGTLKIAPSVSGFRHCIGAGASLAGKEAGLARAWSTFFATVNPAYAFRKSVLEDGGTFEDLVGLNGLLSGSMAAFHPSASLLLTANGVKASKMYCLRPDVRTDDFSFSRSTPAYRKLVDNYLFAESPNIPAREYFNGLLGLRLEMPSTNMIGFSNTPGSGGWVRVNTTPTAGATDPLGGVTGSTELASAITGAASTLQEVTALSEQNVAWSIYVKKGTNNFVAMIINGNGSSNNYVARVFDLSDNSLGELVIGGAGGAHFKSYLDVVGNGWVRLVLVGRPTAFTNLRCEIALAPLKTGNTFEANGRPTTTWAGTESMIIWGGQAEAGKVDATSLINTPDATDVNRGNDVLNAYTVAANLPSNEGTIFFDGRLTDDNVTKRLLLSLNGSTNDSVFLQISAGGNPSASIFAGGVAQGPTIGSGVIALKTRFKVALTFSGTTKRALFLNGVKVGEHIGAITMPQLARFDVFNGSYEALNAMMLLPTALSDADAITLTT